MPIQVLQFIYPYYYNHALVLLLSMLKAVLKINSFIYFFIYFFIESVYNNASKQSCDHIEIINNNGGMRRVIAEIWKQHAIIEV